MVGVGLIIVLSAFIGMNIVSTAHPATYATISCDIKAGCADGEQAVLWVTGESNAHAASYDYDQYSYAVCCSLEDTYSGTEISFTNWPVALTSTSMILSAPDNAFFKDDMGSGSSTRG